MMSSNIDVWMDGMIQLGCTPEHLLLGALKIFLRSRGKELDSGGSAELVLPVKGGEDLNVPAIFLTL